MPSVEFGRLLIFAGLALAVAGILLVSGARIPFFGRLPGDFHLQIGGGSVTLLIGTSIVVSILLTIALNLLFRALNR